MTCAEHKARTPCPHCEWAASGDPVKVASAQARADRVAGRASPSTTLPPLREQAATFAAALTRHALAGFPAADDATKAARLAACGECDRLTPEGRCGSCGCGVAKKAAWERESCPLGRWPKP